MKKTIAYHCSYCKRYYRLSAAAVIKHESKCHYNPFNMSCITCNLLHRGEYDHCVKYPKLISTKGMQTSCPSYSQGPPVVARDYFDRDFSRYFSSGKRPKQEAQSQKNTIAALKSLVNQL